MDCFITGLVLNIAQLSNGSTISTLLLMNVDTEKLSKHYIQFNKLKAVKLNYRKIYFIQYIPRDTGKSNSF